MRTSIMTCVAVATLLAALPLPRLAAQEQQAAVAAQPVTLQPEDGTNVPHLIKFSGVVSSQTTPATAAGQNEPNDASTGSAQQATLSISFSLYQAQEGGSPLWAETQNVQLDSQGRYTVLLGATLPDGLPLDLFTSGQARWLGVQPQLAGAVEQPRVLLVGVPYALKAADADTLGGKPASAYALSLDQATSSSGQATNGNLAPQLRPGQQAQTSKASQIPGPASPVGGSGAPNFIPRWTSSETLGDSIIFQKGDELGVGTMNPGARIDAVSPGIAVRGTSSTTNPSGGAVSGVNTASSGQANGVWGRTNASSGSGVAAFNGASTGPAYGVYAGAVSPNGTGVGGYSYSSTGWAPGVTGATGSSGPGVFGFNWASTGYAVGVYGSVSSPNNAAVVGVTDASVGPTGVYGYSPSTSGTGVFGNVDAASGYTTGVSGQTASPNGTGVVGVNNSITGGTAVAGVVNATSGNATGVAGTIASISGAGVTGVATAASGYTNGVWGQSASPNGTGVSGNASDTSGGGTGVLGSSAGANGGIGVWGSYAPTSGTGVGVRGDIESGATSGTAGLFINWPGQGLVLGGYSGPTYTQVFTVDASGNLDISGNLTVAGSKSARVKMQDGREVALYAVESPENWFEDFGTAQLQGGAAAVSLDPGFLQTVDTAAGYHVFLTPNGDSHGLYVASKSAAAFEVREQGGGNASIAFDYRIVARRRGFESVRLQEVHLPQVSPEMKAGLARVPPTRTMTVPAPPPVRRSVQPPPPPPAIRIPPLPSSIGQ